jgi:hypothetical protein
MKGDPAVEVGISFAGERKLRRSDKRREFGLSRRLQTGAFVTVSLCEPDIPVSDAAKVCRPVRWM